MKQSLLKALRWLIDAIFRVPYEIRTAYVEEDTLTDKEDLFAMVQVSALDPARHVPHLMGRYRTLIGIVGTPGVSDIFSLTFVDGLILDLPASMYIGAKLNTSLHIQEDIKNNGDITPRL